MRIQGITILLFLEHFIIRHFGCDSDSGNAPAVLELAVEWMNREGLVKRAKRPKVVLPRKVCLAE